LYKFPVRRLPDCHALMREGTLATPEQQSAYDVFVSYSHEDEQWVQSELLPRLKSAGLKVCIDSESYQPGEPFEAGTPVVRAIEKAILVSHKTICVFTHTYRESEWCELEDILISSLDPSGRDKRLLPILLKPCELPQRIKARLYVDFTPAGTHDQAWGRLLAALEGLTVAVPKVEEEPLVLPQAEAMPLATPDVGEKPPSVPEQEEEPLAVHVAQEKAPAMPKEQEELPALSMAEEGVGKMTRLPGTQGRNYLDFELRIEKKGQRYQADVVRSPCGEPSNVFKLPFANLELENLVLKLGGPRRGLRGINSPQMQTAREFGSKLFEAVFGKDVYSCFVSSQNEAKHRNLGLRLKLRLEAPELINIPWEYLYDASRGRFLSQFEATPIVRYIDLPEPIEPLAVKPPFQRIMLPWTSVVNGPTCSKPWGDLLTRDCSPWSGWRKPTCRLCKTACCTDATTSSTTSAMVALTSAARTESWSWRTNGVWGSGPVASAWQCCWETNLPCGWSSSMPVRVPVPRAMIPLPERPRPWCAQAMYRR
jgi:hypothetical protein